MQHQGFHGVDFSSSTLTPESCADACRRVLATGVRAFCPTVITAPMGDYAHTLPILAAACKSDEFASSLLGIHLEGPFLCPHPGPVGCHPPEHVLAPSVDVFLQLWDLCAGTLRVLTVAADQPGVLDVIAAARDKGVVVALGHQRATPQQLQAAADAGATLLTHLGNGCAASQDRHANPLMTGLGSDLAASVIADGAHLPASVLRAIVRCKTLSNTLLVSDMAPVAGLGPGTYPCFGKTVEVDVDGVCREPGHPTLAGATRSIVHCANVFAAVCDVGEDVPAAVWQTAYFNPLRTLGVSVSEWRRSAPHPATAANPVQFDDTTRKFVVVKATPSAGAASTT